MTAWLVVMVHGGRRVPTIVHEYLAASLLNGHCGPVCYAFELPHEARLAAWRPRCSANRTAVLPPRGGGVDSALLQDQRLRSGDDDGRSDAGQRSLCSCGPGAHDEQPIGSPVKNACQLGFQQTSTSGIEPTQEYR